LFLKEVRLYNWRKFESPKEGAPGLVVTFKEGLNILIGENDSGKTAIIDAIRMVLGTNSRTSDWIEDEDFSSGTDNLTIECTFSGLSPKEESYFLDWLTVEGEALETTSLRVVLKANKYKDANQVEKISKEILAGPENHEIGMHSIAQEYLKVTYLKPLRDAESELKPGYRSRVARVIEGLEAFQDDEKKEEVIKGFEEAFDELDKELKEPVLDRVDEHLRSFLSTNDKRESQIQNRALTFKEVLRRLELNYDEIKSGLGSTNVLFMALELIALREQEIGAQLTLIEEIEAHLHPQAQLRVIKSFEKYLEDNPSMKAQYILTTHSPTLAASVKLENLILLYNGNTYPMSEEYTLLGQDDYQFLDRFLDATKANLFFAKGVILVEGYAESILVPAIAEAIGRPLHLHGISVVNVQGTRFNRYIPIFLRNKGVMNFPVSVITDMDISPTSHYIHNSQESEELYKKIEKPQTLQEIKDEINEKWTNKDAEKYFKVWDYTEGQINLIKNDIEAKKKSEYRNGEEGIKVFLASPWTLEHSVAKSSLKEEFEKVIVDLRGYKRQKSADEKLEEWGEMVDKHRRATVTYQFVLNNSISKAIIAQRLSERLTDSKKLRGDEELRYIINAINHVTGGELIEDN
jgi:putative ATP-dependent endonuclease of OLD family